MVQREVGERLAAAPGQRAPTACRRCSPSSRARCEVVRAIPRTVFHPVPNVDSVLVRLRAGRRAARSCRRRPTAALRALVGGAFAHRRKTLAGSLALSGRCGGRSREQVRAALERARPPRGRARRAPLAGGLPGAGAAARAMSVRYRALAPAKVNLGLFVGPRAAQRRPARAGQRDAVDLARRRAHARAGAAAGAASDEVVCPGVPGPREENLAARRAARLPRGAPAGTRRRCGCASSSGSRSPPGSAAARPTRPRRCAWPRTPRGSATRSCCSSWPRELGADVPAQVSPGRWLATGAGERLQSAARPRAVRSGCSCCPPRAGCRPPRSTREADRLGAAREPRSELAELARAAAPARSRCGAPLPGDRELLHNDLAAGRGLAVPEIAEALAKAREAGAAAWRS